MTVPQQADADPVKVVIDWLKAHPVASVLGGPEHVGAIKEGPWPQLVVSDGVNGDLRDMRWDAELEVVLDLYGDPSGQPGPAAMRRLMLRAVRAVADMPEEQTSDGTTPVVSAVRAGGREVDEARGTGQPWLSMNLMVTIRPPSRLPAP